jgi:hypothetical protein
MATHIIECPKCFQRLRVPNDRGNLRVTCPKCGKKWEWSSSPNRFEVIARPKRVGMYLALGGCAFFALVGFWMMITGTDFLTGLLSFIFFGGIAVGGVFGMLRRRVTMVLTPEGIEFPISPRFKPSLVPWSDIEKVGILAQSGNRWVGLRLNNYDHYLGSMSPDLAKHQMKTMKFAKLLSYGLSVLDIPEDVSLWSKLSGNVDPLEVIKKSREVGDLAEMLLFARNVIGYEVVFHWAQLDRPTKKFVSLIEEYRAMA